MSLLYRSSPIRVWTPPFKAPLAHERRGRTLNLTYLAIGAVLLGIASPSLASHCTGFTTTEEAIELRTPVEAATTPQNAPGPDGWWTYYMLTDPCAQVVAETNCIPGPLGPYAETNGIPGLQRRDHERDDTCHGMIPADAPAPLV